MASTSSRNLLRPEELPPLSLWLIACSRSAATSRKSVSASFYSRTRAFPDTSFFCAVSRTQAHSARADMFREARTEPLGVSSWLRREFRPSWRLQTWRHGHERRKGFARTEAQLRLRHLESDLAVRVLPLVAVDWSDVQQRAEALSARSKPEGCRVPEAARGRSLRKRTRQRAADEVAPWFWNVRGQGRWAEGTRLRKAAGIAGRIFYPLRRRCPSGPRSFWRLRRISKGSRGRSG